MEKLSESSSSSKLKDRSKIKLKETSEEKSGLSDDDEFFLKDAIVLAGAPDTQKLDRKDSGISVNSGKSMSPYDNVFRRKGSSRGSQRMAKVMEEKEPIMKGPKPKKPVKPVKWIKVDHNLAKSKYNFTFLHLKKIISLCTS